MSDRNLKLEIQTMAYYKIDTARNGEFYFNLLDDNNERILTSETYETEQGCINGIHSVKLHGGHEASYSLFTGNDGQYSFSIKAGNHEKIAKSEGYTKMSSRQIAMQNCMKEAPSAVIKP